ncbi:MULTISPECIES: phage tail protein [Ralstonia]|uniref:phage tail tape measure protein n=1 Tax=Ralstonia TaxID=48736 RepID=UPI000A97A6AF|nr:MULTISPECIES: phage tail protein [Ralstonia]PLT16293.1 phage tail protein [Ralstonia mannitolilytica]
MSDARRLRLEVVLQAVDKATRPVRDLLKANNELARSMKATRDHMKALERAQGLTEQFGKLRGNIRETASALREARERVGRLTRAVQAADSPSARLTQNLGKATAEAERLTRKFQAQRAELVEVRQRLQDAGRGTQTMAQFQEQLRSATAAATHALAEQDARLKALNGRARAQAAVQRTADKIRTRAGNLAAAGAGASVAGMATGAPIWKGIGESKHYELEKTRIAALGLGDAATKESIEFAKQMKAYGVSQVDKAELMRDALSVFADAHHAEMVLPTLAKMKFANAAVFGQAQGAENERMFLDLLKVVELRGGLSSPEEFRKQADMIQRVITATGGRVQSDQWLQVIKRGGLAAKGMDSEAFFYALEPVVQEMGGNTVGTALMSAYQNLYQGKTTKRTLGNLDRLGLIADRSKVKEDKAGQVSFMDPGALKGADVFRKSQFEWLETVLLPTLAEKGITGKDQVLDAIGSIFSNRTASNLMAQMYLQRDQIHKNMRLNKGADSIDQLDARAKALPQGKELEALARVHDLQKEIGEKVLPLYASALEWVARAASGVTKFMQENPGLAKAMAVGVGALAASLLVLGPIMLAVASVLGPYAMLYLVMGKMGIAGGVLSGVLRGLAGAFTWVMRAVGLLGRVLLMNPIGLLVTAIGVAAYLIYQYWEPISGFFRGLWGQVKEAFNGGIGGVSALVLNWSPLGLFHAAFATVMQWFGIEVPTKFTEFGANIIQGLANGIKGAIGWVVDAVGGVADRTIGLFKEKLGIHSPSRVFAALGAFTMAGLQEGLADGEGGPLGTVQRMAYKLAGIGAGVAIGTAPAIAAPVTFDTRSPLSTSAVGATAAPAAFGPITINIYPQAGMDAQAIAQAVRDELRKIENQNAARARSRLSDRD